MLEHCTALPSVLSYAERDLLESAWSWVRSPLFAEGYRNRGEKENSSSSFLTDITTCSLGVALLLPPPTTTTATTVTAAGYGVDSLSGEGVGNRERESSLTVTTPASPSVTVTAAGLLLSWIQQHDSTHPNFKVNFPLTPI